MRAQKKNVVKLLSLFLAVLLAAGGVLTVSAGADEEEKPDSKEAVIYLDTRKGDDSNDGLTAGKPLKTVQAVQKYFDKIEAEKEEDKENKENQTVKKIVVLCGKTELTSEQKKEFEAEKLTAMTAEEYKKYNEATDSGAQPSPTPAPSQSPEPSVSPSPTATPEPTVTAAPTATPEPTVTVTPTVTPSPTASPTPGVTPTVTPTPTVTVTPTEAPSPTVSPSPSETPDDGKNAVTPAPTVTPAPDNSGEGKTTPSTAEDPAEEGADGNKARFRTFRAFIMNHKDGGDPPQDTATGEENREEEHLTASAAEGNPLLAAPAVVNPSAVNEVKPQNLRKLPGTDLVGNGTPSASTGSGSSSGASSGSSGSSGKTQNAGSHSLTPQVSAPVKTGDLSQMYPFIISLCMAILACAVLYRLMLENKRRMRNAGYRAELDKFREDCRI